MNRGTLEDCAYAKSPVHALDARVKLASAFLVILSVMTLPRHELALAAAHLLFPVALVALGDLPVGLVLRRLGMAAPFVLAVGVWTPLLDTQPVQVATFQVARGWFLFASLMLRFAVAVGTLIAIAGTTHVGRLSGALRWFRVPGQLVLLITVVYRYLFVIFDEARRILLASRLRGGPKVPALGQWGRLMGTLLGRTVRRGEQVHTAMELRGFSGELPPAAFPPLKTGDKMLVPLVGVLLAGLQVWAR